MQLRSLKEIGIITNSRQQWNEILTRACSLYGESPQNNQHQDQTKLRFHSFLYNWEQLDLRETNWEILFMIWSLRIKIVPGIHLITSLHNPKYSWNTQALLCPTFPWNLRPRIGARYHSDILSSRSNTDGDCRTTPLFIPYRPRVIHALQWDKRLLHYEWQCTLQTFLYVNMVSLTTKQFNIFSSPSGLVYIY